MPEYKQQCDYVEGTLDVLRISGRRQATEMAPSGSEAESKKPSDMSKKRQSVASIKAGGRDGDEAPKGASETLETRIKNIWESFILTLQHSAEFITTNLSQVLPQTNKQVTCTMLLS